ncbi:MAG TPA: TonB family protein [Candidatus Sulfotelmatobacter sp.]|nr:TonB family protein [Candidatus Sulfotelmatobacter sp.]
MSVVGADLKNPHAADVPRLLVELPSWPRVFFGNLRDLLFPRRVPDVELRSAPAEFWPDVFVKRRLPWGRFLQSCGYHVIAGTLLIALTRFFATQPRVAPTPAFQRSEVVYYSASEYLPPLDTREQSPSPSAKPDPEYSAQPIVSVPARADNHLQTIVTPPQVKLKNDIAMPNIVAWSDAEQRPRLAIPAAPLIPAAEINRMAPQLEASVVTAPPDAARLANRRNLPQLASAIVAPPPELGASNSPAAFPGLHSALIAPPPSVTHATTRRLGDLNISRPAVIAPAPVLPVAEQRAVPGGRVNPAALMRQVVAPPASAAGAALDAAGSRGRLIALNLHPVMAAPPNSLAGNRHGTFAATPEGHAGASGTPGSTAAGRSDSKGSGAAKQGNSNLPSGLYVGNMAANAAPVAGDPQKTSPPVNPTLLASARPPRVTGARIMQPQSSANLSEAERAVFGGRKFYSVTLNMPNLNSAGGSWVIRFAELNHESADHDPGTPAADLSQPMATRKVDPAYPMQLMRENVHGTVILYAVIHADGSVGNIRVLRGVDDRLDRFASEAVAQWKFEPATKNGAPVDVEATFQIPFRPTRTGSSY